MRPAKGIWPSHGSCRLVGVSVRITRGSRKKARGSGEQPGGLEAEGINFKN